MKPKILIADTYYPDFLKSLPFDASSAYDVELRKVLDRSFGTADFYSRNLKAMGWDAVDVIANHGPLQQMWDRENGFSVVGFGGTGTVLAQARTRKSDVVFLQDLSYFTPLQLKTLRSEFLLAGQCSCPWPGDAQIAGLQLCFTSFPHYVPRIEALGVRAVYVPLAFEPEVLERTNTVEITGPAADEFKRYAPRFTERPHDVVFIGGVGAPSHWRYGMEVLETVAREIPTFKWWGYGYETLPADSALRRCYQGEAWGLQMYEILLQSKICLNRHGEVAEGYANNMRMFEATGCGALLLTEEAPNLRDFFRWGECLTYRTAAEAVMQIQNHLQRWSGLETTIAKNGQARTLRDHTYAQRMKTVSETLMGMLSVGSLSETGNHA